MSDWRQEGTLSTDSTWSDQFRIDFPEFAHDSPEIYPDSMINFWYGIARKLLNIERWDDLLETGYKLFVAHKCSLALAAEAAAALGDRTGASVGLVGNSYNVGGVSVSYDISATTMPAAGEFNSTIYGKQFYQLMIIVGTGGYQV